MKPLLLTSIVTLWILGYCQAQNKTFRNPILDDNFSIFSSVYKHHGSYYYVSSRETSGNVTIEIIKSPILSNFRDGERREIYRAPTGATSLGGTRMEYLQGDLYIYFYMRLNGGDFSDRRIYVIKSLDPCNPLGNWSNAMRVSNEEVNAHQGTVLQHANGELYLIWVNENNSTNQTLSLHISRMETPIKVVGASTHLRLPTLDWESHDAPVNDGPSILQRNGATFLIFSASGAGSPDNCLGIMGIDGGKHPMLVSNWWNDVNHCVFARNDVEGVWGTGFTSFVKSPDDSETWMMYHAWGEDSLYHPKTVRIQKLEWAEMNRPKFPIASGVNKDFEVPGGE